MTREREWRTTVVIELMAIAVLLATIGLRLSGINNILQNQFDYQTEADMCYEQAREYLAPCHVERDEDGSYHWYFNSYEGESYGL